MTGVRCFSNLYEFKISQVISFSVLYFIYWRELNAFAATKLLNVFLLLRFASKAQNVYDDVSNS